MPNKFNYTYNAPTQKERETIEHIKNQYMPTEPLSKLEKLKKLDSKVKTTPTIVALVLGIVGILIFGLGLTLALEFNQIYLGIIVGLIGGLPICLAYPVYNKLFDKLKKKHGPEIIKLSNELLNEKTDSNK